MSNDQKGNETNGILAVGGLNSTRETVNKISGGGKSRGLFFTALTCETISKRKHLLHTEVDFSVHRDGRKKAKQMATKLERIAELSSQNPNMVFTSETQGQAPQNFYKRIDSH